MASPSEIPPDLGPGSGSRTSPVPPAQPPGETASSAGPPNPGSLSSASSAASASSRETAASTSPTTSRVSGGVVSSASSAAAATASAAPGLGSVSSGHSAGVVAGAAVGAAVGAAILAFLITFMFLRQKNRKRRGSGKDRSGGGGFSTYPEKALPKDPSQGDNAALAARGWQKHLPQPADDKTVRSAVGTLFEQVELHVENYYRDSAVSVSEGMQAQLLRVDSPHLPDSVVALLPRARSQTALIKHCLLSYIVASISTDDDSVPSLLPADYVTLPHLARATGQKKAGYDQALSQWRVLSAYLRPAPKNDPSYLSQRDATVSAAAATFTNALSPWASESYSDSVRRQNLAEILKSAAEVGILIFSQPGSFRFQWSTGQDHRSVVVVIAPALLKTADEHAIPLDRPQVMIQMATQSI